jgi:hypothetical protein
LKQQPAAAAGLMEQTLIGAHHDLDLRLADAGLEGRQIRLAEIFMEGSTSMRWRSASGPL